MNYEYKSPDIFGTAYFLLVLFSLTSLSMKLQVEVVDFSSAFNNPDLEQMAIASNWALHFVLIAYLFSSYVALKGIVHTQILYERQPKLVYLKRSAFLKISLIFLLSFKLISPSTTLSLLLLILASSLFFGLDKLLIYQLPYREENVGLGIHHDGREYRKFIDLSVDFSLFVMCSGLVLAILLKPLILNNSVFGVLWFAISVVVVVSCTMGTAWRLYKWRRMPAYVLKSLWQEPDVRNFR